MQTATGSAIPTATAEFYRRALRVMNDAGLRFMLGGAWALEQYTGISRQTKDLDAFVHRDDWDHFSEVMSRHGWRTELTFPHWLGKVWNSDEDDFIDLIFSSGNGVAVVDDLWFENAVKGRVLGVEVPLIPAEEMIWSKSFVQERERFDGADIHHLLRARAEHMDWDRLLARFGDRWWRVLLMHLVSFGFVYPADRHRIPEHVMRDLLGRLDRELDSPGPHGRCQGTILSRTQYQVDVDHWGLPDARFAEGGPISCDVDVAAWEAEARGIACVPKPSETFDEEEDQP